MHKVLVRLPNWVGDLIMALPALKCLRENLPHASLSVMTRPHLIPIIPADLRIKGLIPYPKKQGLGALAHIWKMSLELKKEAFERVILFQNAFEAALLTWLARIPRREGYTRDMRGFLLTKRVHPLREGGHHVNYYLRLIEALGLKVTFERPRLSVPLDYIQWADGFLEDLGMGNAQRLLIGMAPGAAYGPSKMWPAPYYRRLARLITEREGTQVLLFGSKDEYQICQSISGDLKDVINLCGMTDLAQAMAIMARCRAFVSNDSGLMHMAAALDIPLIAIFGSTDPTLTGPLGLYSHVLKIDIDCSPCFKPRCPKGTYQCLSSISAEEVFSQLTDILEERDGKTCRLH